jgi:hypothetical protein
MTSACLLHAKCKSRTGVLLSRLPVARRTLFCRRCSFTGTGDSSQSQSHIATDAQSVSKSWYRAPSGAHDQIMTRYLFLSDSYVLVSCGAPTLTRGRVCLLYMLLDLASAVFSGPSPLVLATIFYCLRFETSLFVASYDSRREIRRNIATDGQSVRGS